MPIALHALFTGKGGEGLYLVWPAWVSLYALAAYGSRRQLLVGLAVAVVSLAVHDWNDPLAWRAGAEAAWSAAWWDLLLFVAPLVGGIVAGSRRARTLATEKALVEAQARAAVAEERARIARELHDVVTHHINLVVLQAMAASGMLDRDPERVREPLQVIERSGREALTEMRRLLGVLRDEDAERTAGPAAGRGRRRRARRHRPATPGCPSGWPSRGRPRRLPAGLALTVYRIVQESLTNAARHAAGSRVGVSLRYEPDAVDVAVVDDGGRAARRRAARRTRAARHAGAGGRLRRRRWRPGPSADGGFAVHARLPAAAGGVVITVLVADDQALIRDSFRLLLDLEPDMEVVGEAGDGEEAVAQTRRSRPDVVLMDIRMPVLDGLAATRALTRAGSAARVLILTTYDADEYLYDAMQAGACGFLLKDVRREQLAGAVRTVAAGDALLHPALTRRLVERFVQGPPPGGRPAALAALTERETEVLTWSGGGCPTPRSRPSSSSARRRSRRTSAGC